MLTGVFIGVVAVALLLAWVLSPGAAETASPGATAPDFSVAVIGGGSFDLSDHLDGDGRTLVVNLWASWCLPCRDEIPEIDAFAAANPQVQVVGVAVRDTEPGAVTFAEELSPDYPLALGNPSFEAAYPAIVLPITYVIGPDGLVAEVYHGIVDQERLESLVSGDG